MMSRLTGLIFAGMIALTPVLAWAQGGGQGFQHSRRMFGGGYAFYGPLMIILVITIVIAVVVMIMRWNTSHGAQVPAEKSPQDILKERYARGEITTKEFQERRKVLGD